MEMFSSHRGKEIIRISFPWDFARKQNSRPRTSHFARRGLTRSGLTIPKKKKKRKIFLYLPHISGKFHGAGWTTSLSVRLARLNDLGYGGDDGGGGCDSCDLIFLNNGESLAKARVASVPAPVQRIIAAEANRASEQARNGGHDTEEGESFRFRRARSRMGRLLVSYLAIRTCV